MTTLKKPQSIVSKYNIDRPGQRADICTLLVHYSGHSGGRAIQKSVSLYWAARENIFRPKACAEKGGKTVDRGIVTRSFGGHYGGKRYPAQSKGRTHSRSAPEITKLESSLSARCDEGEIVELVITFDNYKRLSSVWNLISIKAQNRIVRFSSSSGRIKVFPGIWLFSIWAC